MRHTLAETSLMPQEQPLRRRPSVQRQCNMKVAFTYMSLPYKEKENLLAPIGPVHHGRDGEPPVVLLQRLAGEFGGS